MKRPQKKNKLIWALSGLSILGLICFFCPTQPKMSLFNVFSSNRFAVKSWIETEDHDDDKDHPTDEDQGGDDSLKMKKKMYDFRAYPAKTIPAGSREKAWRQFQALYPENQTLTFKPANQKVGGNGR